MKNGIFISLEGIEATGKSTIAERLKEQYEVIENKNVMIAKELDEIKPGLLKNDIVICEHYAHSTFAYQEYEEGMDFKKIHPLKKFMTDGIIPDIIFYIDIPVEVSVERIIKSDKIYNFNKMDIEYSNRVRQRYLDMYEAEEFGNIILIDGTLSIAEIVEEITLELDHLMTLKSLLQIIETNDEDNGDEVKESEMLKDYEENKKV